ncbi:Rieske (2Fe-2S) protein [Mycobacterium sp. ITM-2016-00316]|uniref:Rieske (2Fe-2S) protein n=1 Tax=Mycobacterium sp. ITM-2016-00316 TaxID=2099695 RepID=UPI000CF927E3|nr:Rieske (2Fe-2S) protein [Mycobacterium sp. ITM-2016-00316]WNG81883.1 Rieske (2Fe-2S) protein [Mycobacterium sp. ITM-2016-00316]
MAPPLNRRHVIVGASAVVGAGALVSCAGAADEPAPAQGEPAPAQGEPAPAQGESGVLATTSRVPVGSALIVDGIVLTQPAAGEFTGFSAVCPHAGCAVSKVDGAQVICPCHGSTFGLDGAVVSGPAREPLAPAPITVRGDSIVAG